ncbi:M20 aminoacylase family protein [Rhodospira trueperi]|uniref:Hippurate hydrolase n=1 Tax=Rhodospira trueperi TaxID=69960 RepID=A0A1G7EKR4_9PROT|nr:M20 aminoacylase family protein [Rhodospira trueperi]SDE63996.1 hippurate hydrolase [Rhodospira trueperi]
MTHTGPLNRVEALRPQMQDWRRDFHAHPEIAYEEVRTSRIVAEALTGWGLEVETGLAKTGVVGTVRGSRPGSRAIALRADMDALPMTEENTFEHRSRHEGRMHGCGHDGHTAMLLGAAKVLADAPDFAGTVHLIFQPAEEGGAGAMRMIEDGLFERFPVESVWSLHNWPGLEAGRFNTCPGPILAATDMFKITLKGKGGHGAMPHLATDVTVAAAALVSALQSIVSRSLDPVDSGVISVTTMHGGEAFNVLPSTITLGGTTRALTEPVRDTIEERMGEMVHHIAAAYGVTGDLKYERCYPPTVNSPAETALAVEVMRSIVGSENVEPNCRPTLGGEDFAFMLQKKPGCYVRLGGGGGANSCGLHNPGYDFNDDVLTLGATYWVRLVERLLGGDR